MGLSLLTRYDLFMESGDIIGRGDGILRFRDNLSVMNMYYDSARLIKNIERIIIDGEGVPRMEMEEYQSIFWSNIGEIKDPWFAQRIRDQVLLYINKEEERKLPPYELLEKFFRFLLRVIADCQEKIIKTNFIMLGDYEIFHTARKKTFLSYAYFDRGLTQALFYYFWQRSGFLYVNWMWDGINNHGSITKKKLESVLKDSDQFLFLRTTNSELRVRGNNSIRQWCAWEIGNFYTKHKEEKYYTSFYDKTQPRNDILDTFRPMKKVVMGKIQ